MAWADWVNAHGGINGHPVKLIQMNDQNSEALAVTDVHTLVNTDHVVAIVFDGDAGNADAYESFIDANKIPVLGGAAYTPIWYGGASGASYFFPAGQTNLQNQIAQAQVAKNLGLKKFGAIACSGAIQCNESVSGVGADAQELGLKMAYGAEAPNVAPNYTANCVAAKQAGAQMLDLFIASAAEGMTIANNCAQQGYNPDWVFAADAMTAGYLVPAFNNAYSPDDTIPYFSTSPVASAYHAAVKKYAGNINFQTVEEPASGPDAWAAGLELQEAIKLSGATGVPTSADIVRGLLKFRNQTLGGFTGALTFKSTDNKEANCYFLIKIKNAKFTTPNGTQTTCISEKVALAPASAGS